jgi:hypothetical protein
MRYSFLIYCLNICLASLYYCSLKIQMYSSYSLILSSFLDYAQLSWVPIVCINAHSGSEIEYFVLLLVFISYRYY